MYRYIQLTGSDLEAFKVSFLLNCVVFRLMNNNLVPRCADNLNTFIPKPHLQLFRVSHILNQLIFRSPEFQILIFLVPGELFKIWTIGATSEDSCSICLGTTRKPVWTSDSLFNLQVNYWNSNVNEVQGVVIDQEGKVVHRLFGKWHEGLYCGVAPSAKCIWRPGKMLVRNSGRYR